ncbi:uncharacterized protein At5g39865 [Malus sylvestris]|uniref:uncharacterized protein At5g39865 n=1 Tax=Malus sylvestris TaxID=3752 RepID=UPI0021ABA1D8|nr:uncharacterized protein At5g39865 [Malus sylvestris]
MGCATSKEKRCRHCESAISPISRSYSMHVHHPPQTKGDSNHVVALTSSTLGSLNRPENRVIANGCDDTNENMIEHENKEFSVGLIEAKTWSNMIEAKIPKVVPKTPTRTPPGEPETINTWELMEGLEDMSSLRSPAHHLRSFSFDVVRDLCPRPISPSDRQKSRFQENGNSPPKPQPMWLQISDDNDQVKSNSLIADFDPDVISAFRKSLSEIKSEEDPFDLAHLVVSKEPAWACNDVLEVQDKKGRDRVVLYFTSLRGVRKTYEDCCHVRVILKGIGVRVDERDVSMHSGFKEELRELLKDRYNVAPLPRVFVGNKYVGGADEIRQLHEDGKLEKLLDSCEKLDGGCGGGDGGGVCDACGDIRFVPCETCSGSCKIYYEDIDRDGKEEEEEEAEEGESGFQRCPDCNENGLIRCPICCY